MGPDPRGKRALRAARSARAPDLRGSPTRSSPGSCTSGSYRRWSRATIPSIGTSRDPGSQSLTARYSHASSGRSPSLKAAGTSSSHSTEHRDIASSICDAGKSSFWESGRRLARPRCDGTTAFSSRWWKRPSVQRCREDRICSSTSDTEYFARRRAAISSADGFRSMQSKAGIESSTALARPNSAFRLQGCDRLKSLRRTASACSPSTIRTCSSTASAALS